MADIEIEIETGYGSRWRSIAIVVAIAAAVIIIVALLYHPSVVAPPPSNVTPTVTAPSMVIFSVGDAPSDPALNVTISNFAVELINGTWIECPANATLNMMQLINTTVPVTTCQVPSTSIVAVSVNITRVVYISTTTMPCSVPAHFITIQLSKVIFINATMGANITIDMQMVRNINITTSGCFVTPKFWVYTKHVNATIAKFIKVPMHRAKTLPAPPIPMNASLPVNSTYSPVIINGTGFTCVVPPVGPPRCNVTAPPMPVVPPRTGGYVNLTIYNPSNQPTANPHVQPIALTCGFIQSIYATTYNATPPDCSSLGSYVEFMLGRQVLPSWFEGFENVREVFWVRTPSIPAQGSITITMYVSKTPIQNPLVNNASAVFYAYNTTTTALTPGLIYVLNPPTNGAMFVYGSSSGSAWYVETYGNKSMIVSNLNPNTGGSATLYSGYPVVITQSQTLLGFLQSFLQSPLPSQVFTTTVQQQATSVTALGTVYLNTSQIPKPLYLFTLFNPPSGSVTRYNPFYIQLSQCSISSNPYPNGVTGPYGLFSCIAIQYGATTAAVWFYLPPNGQGTILSLQNFQYPSSPTGRDPWIYIGTNGILYFGDYAAGFWQVYTSISPGWHLVVGSEWASSTSGPFYIQLWLDGNNIGQKSATNTPQLFGYSTYYPYSDVGTGYAASGWPGGNGGWFWFNGPIVFIALYNTVLTQTQVQQLVSATMFSSSVPVLYAFDYPPNGIEPVVVGASSTTPTGLSILTQSQVGTTYFAIHVAPTR